MSSDPAHLRLLVPLDGSRAAEQSLVHARALATAFCAEIQLLRVVVSGDTVGPQGVDCVDWQLRQRQARAYLEHKKQELEKSATPVSAFVEEGSPARAIVRFARRERSDLIILSRTGEGGASGLGDGATTRKVVAGAPCSVLLVGAEEQPASLEEPVYRRLLVPVDDSVNVEWTVALAAVIAEVHGSEVFLLRVLEDPVRGLDAAVAGEAGSLLARVRAIAKLQASRRLQELRPHIPDDVRVITELRTAEDPAAELDRAAREWGVDLILVCAHGSGEAHPWKYGTVAEALLAHGACPLLVFQASNREASSRFRSIYMRDEEAEVV